MGNARGPTRRRRSPASWKRPLASPAPQACRSKFNWPCHKSRAKPAAPADCRWWPGPRPAPPPPAAGSCDRPSALRRAARSGRSFRGPNRDAVCTDTGSSKTGRPAEPKLLWHFSGLGKGYSSARHCRWETLHHGRPPRYRTAQFGSGRVSSSCWLSAAEQPAASFGPPPSVRPRTTDRVAPPTLDGDRLFALGTDGDLVCLEDIQRAGRVAEASLVRASADR